MLKVIYPDPSKLIHVSNDLRFLKLLRPGKLYQLLWKDHYADDPYSDGYYVETDLAGSQTYESVLDVYTLNRNAKWRHLDLRPDGYFVLLTATKALIGVHYPLNYQGFIDPIIQVLGPDGNTAWLAFGDPGHVMSGVALLEMSENPYISST